MIMVHHLFKKFLENQSVYSHNVDYWQKTVKAILGDNNQTFKDYLNTNFANGTPCLDGNPIFHAVFENKAIRIIQEEPESHEVEISAWLTQVEIEDKTIAELVIALELSTESKEIAEDFIKAWITENVDAEEMQRLIDNLIDKKIPQYTERTLNP
jgi:hypothetical protein